MRRLVVPCLTFAMASGLPAKDLYVSPQGRDGNPGTRDRPLATLPQAFEALRGSAGGTVWLAPGEYATAAGLQLEAAHSGTQQTPLTIRAETAHSARISGGREVKDFHPIGEPEAAQLISAEARQHVLVADLKAQGFPPLAPLPDQFRAPGCEEVIFGEQPMQPARWPNEGFTAFTEVIDAGASKPVHWVTREVYRPGSFKFPTDRPKQWDFSRGIYLHGFWCYEWADEVLKAASYQAGTQELRLAAKHAYGIGHPWRKNWEHHFYATHVFEELDQPGEYYLDRRANRLYFWPPGDLNTTPVRLSLCRSPLVQATGVANVVLRDLVFENGCNWAVQLNDCSNARIENCLVRNMGIGGIKASGGRDNHIVDCEVTRTGSMAIGLNAGDRRSLTKGKCSVEGNRLHHLGRYDWMRGRGVVLGGCGNRVANNLIHHGPTGAISYGGNEHLLELNEIHDVCLLYSDVGVFYTGRDWASRGNVVRWNYIHDIANNRGTGSQAIYLDDCDSGDEVIGNIVFGGVGRGVLLGGGRDNTVRGNLFLFLPKGIHVDARGPRGITLDKPGSWNLKAKCEAVGYLSPLWRQRYPKLATVLENQPLLPMGNAMKNNIFVGCKQAFALSKDVKPQWLTRENNVELAANDFAFLPASPAAGALDLSKLQEIWAKVPGFDPIPVEKIGPQGRR